MSYRFHKIFIPRPDSVFAGVEVPIMMTQDSNPVLPVNFDSSHYAAFTV